MGGEGVETSENLKLEEKPEENGGEGNKTNKKLEENDQNFMRMTKTLFNMKLVWVSINT